MSTQYLYQLAGHAGAVTQSRTRVGHVRKVCSVREAQFYQECIHKNVWENPYTAEVLRWIPRCAEVELSPSACWIELEDITAHMTQPCLLDLKLGRTSVEPARVTTHAKRLRMREKDLNSTTAALGIRLAGMRSLSPSNPAPLVRHSAWGRTLRQPDLIGAVRQFIGLKEEAPSAEGRARVSEWLKQVELLIAAFERLGGYQFISTSILVAYDAQHAGAPRMKLIDFAHVQTRPSTVAASLPSDPDCLFGLCVLRRLLDDMLFDE